MTHHPRLVICDLDGTLADTSADLTAAVNALRADYHLPPLSPPTVISYVGNGVAKLIERSLRGHDFTLDDAIARMKHHYQGQMPGNTTLYPTVRTGLETLRHNDWRLAVVTNKPAAATRELLAALAVDTLFDVILGGDEIPLKPDPGGLLMAMADTAASPARTWIVGDNWTDLAAGRLAGISRCFVRYGFGTAGDETYDLAVDRFADFVASAMTTPTTMA